MKAINIHNALLKKGVKQLSIAKQTEAKLFEGLCSKGAEQPEFFASRQAESCSHFSNRLDFFVSFWVKPKRKVKQECSCINSTSRGIELNNVTTLTTMKGNILNTNDVGIIRMNNSFPGNQGTPNLCWANQWTPLGAYSVGKPETYTVMCTAAAGYTNIYAPNVANTNKPIYNAKDLPSTLKEFQWISCSNSLYTCSDGSGSGGNSSSSSNFANTGYKQYAIGIAEDGLEYPIYEDAARFYDRLHLLENIALDSTLLNDTSIANYYYAVQNEDVYLMHEYELALKDGNDIMAQIKLAGLDATDEIVSNYRIVNEIYMQTYQQDIDTFTQEQTEMLMDIAHQCPFTGGNAVFQARGMLALIDTVGYNDSLLCGEGYAYRATNKTTKNVTQLKSKPFDFIIQPNPANNTANLVYINNEVCDNCQLRIYNSVGILITTILLDKTSNSTALDISKWPSGIYICNVTKGNKLTVNKKFIVSHDK